MCAININWSPNIKKIIIASDHGAVDLKDILFQHMTQAGYSVRDAGIAKDEKADYADMAAIVAKAILNGEAERGVLLCGSGIGISIAANRFPGIRSALCHDEYTARMSRMHNDANIISLGGRIIGTELAKAMIDVWLNTEFEGGRHICRIEKIDEAAVEEWQKILKNRS